MGLKCLRGIHGGSRKCGGALWKAKARNADLGVVGGERGEDRREAKNKVGEMHRAEDAGVTGGQEEGGDPGVQSEECGGAGAGGAMLGEGSQETVMRRFQWGRGRVEPLQGETTR